MSHSSIWRIDKIPSGATTPAQSGLGSNSNERILYVLQSSWTRASPSDGLGH